MTTPYTHLFHCDCHFAIIIADQSTAMRMMATAEDHGPCEECGSVVRFREITGHPMCRHGYEAFTTAPVELVRTEAPPPVRGLFGRRRN